jgi:peptidoglycan/LPS O-acetylase OafA/YrhL
MDRETAKPALEYMPQLDGLRALAVGVVVLQHFQLLTNGAQYGVHLFFVLSGFLITGILLSSRLAAETRGVAWTHALRQFYVRRVLRIFPLYYLVVFAGIAVNAAYAREFAPWLLSYTINLKMAAQGWYIGNFAHFWSLAVEEQYYLVWPWLILLLPRRRLVPAALIMTVIGPLFRLAVLLAWSYSESTLSGLQTYIATPTALDSLGMGSLIAIMMRSESGRRILNGRLALLVPVIGLVVELVVTALPAYGWNLVLSDTATALIFGWVIYTASSGFSGVTGRLLGARPLVFVGRISYGVYVYHPLVPPAMERLAPVLGIAVPSAFWPRFFTYTALTLLVATISWYAFERPINNLKRYFAYVGGDRPTESLGATASLS